MDSSHLQFVTAPGMDGYARAEDSRNRPGEGMPWVDGMVPLQILNTARAQLHRREETRGEEICLPRSGEDARTLQGTPALPTLCYDGYTRKRPRS
jgi:hypothetical protein